VKKISCDKTVIATGGSMVYSAAAMESLKKHGLAVWLDTERRSWSGASI
jgi:shikimate kinase